MWTLLLLSMLSAPFQDKQEPKTERKLDLENTKLLFFDSSRELTLKILNDGKVELTVQEEDKAEGKKVSKTYLAATAAEFRTQYPERVKKYQMGRTRGRG